MAFASLARGSRSGTGLKSKLVSAPLGSGYKSEACWLEASEYMQAACLLPAEGLEAFTLKSSKAKAYSQIPADYLACSLPSCLPSTTGLLLDSPTFA